MLAPLNLHGTVVTFDALHSQTAHARFLVEDKHAHYIALIKGDQPTLHQCLKALTWREVPLLAIENKIHHVRDTTYAEDASRVRTGTAPRAMAFPLRNDDEGARHSMDAVVATSLMRMAAADLSMSPWQRPSDAYLVQLGLDALVAGIEAPSLPLLAGLGRGEHAQAREMFDLVLEELGLLPLTSEDLAKARWTAARWWAVQIVARQLDPLHGAKLICEEAAAELDYPDVLQPMVDLARGIDLLNDQTLEQQRFDEVTSAARDLLATDAYRNTSL
ncbi:hypothetical protein GCM10010260_29930 [Streptomyces filipinensis]|uniref:Uncharacterized protein n=1 Tax=Streptomyces filipinensis TaxID=66887 RepID=A0A918MAJ7_9ACTN|nr:hypothetical protein GCM10010260_29930 [Streptomyces filipinensis]